MLVSAICLASPFWAALGQTRSVWQIGKFDESPFEFSQREQHSVRFEIGKSNPKEDWPSRQATGDAYTVLFNLPVVHGAYTLRISALIEQPRIPALRLEINGHAGTFFQHPKLSYSRTDSTYAFDPHESRSTLNIDLPPSFLKKGENTLTITCVDDPPTPSGEKEIGGITYDAVALDQDGAASSRAPKTQVDVQPTIFYRTGPGGLNELVNAFVRFAQRWHSGTARLEVNGNSHAAALEGGEFGEARLSFEVPEWTGTIPAKMFLPSDPAHAFETQLTAERKWTIFVVPHTHLDVGYTDYQGKVAETQARVLSQAQVLIEEHPDFRFSMDGSWNLQQLLSTRSEAKRNEILNLIRTGKIAVPAQNCNLLTAYASLETLYRSLYASKEIALRYGLSLEYANITDVPTYSGSYPSILASSGMKYWAAGANNDRAPIFYFNHWNEKSPFWWIGPDGKRILFWYSRHYEHVQTLFGLPPQINAIRESLPVYLQAYSKPAYKMDAALLFGTQVENTDLFPSTATFADEWDQQYAYPKLIYATFPDFFHYIEQHHANDLETFQGDGGGYWEDGVGSDAFFEQEDRENQNRVLSAEILSTATRSIDPNLSPPRGLLSDIWENVILFSEHTWTSYNSVSQPDSDEAVKQLRVKDARADRANLEIEDLIHRSMSQLANDIHVPANTLVVFNSLNWTRDLMVETDLLQHLVDLATQQDVPLQVLYRKQNFLRVRFIAKDVPGVGYRCFRIEGEMKDGPADSQTSH